VAYVISKGGRVASEATNGCSNGRRRRQRASKNNKNDVKQATQRNKASSEQPQKSNKNGVYGHSRRKRNTLSRPVSISMNMPSTGPPPPAPPAPDDSQAATGAPVVYYEKGSVELAVETPVMTKRLEKRRHLTGTSERLLIVLVGLPARGKSFLSRKLLNYLTWRGNQCKVFNVGKYRREAAAHTASTCDGGGGGDGDNNNSSPVHQDASFFDDSNEFAAKIRQKAAEMALTDALEFLEDNDRNMPETEDTSHSLRRQYQRIAIFDVSTPQCPKAEQAH